MLNGKCPLAWKQALIYPIPKSGQKNKRDPLSYRGISLQSAVLKIYASILNKRLTQWLEDNDILCDAQNGFRPARSCQDHMITLHNIAVNQSLLGKEVFACFVDLKKAFDSVNRNLLWHKLTLYGINGNFLAALEGMYEDFQSAVELNGHCTPFFQVSCGVKQGCLLSPSLFNIFLNDLLMDIKESGRGIQCGKYANISILAYADDIVLLAPNPCNLQALISKLQMWCLSNGITVNINKTKVVHFRAQRRQRSDHVFTYEDRPLEYCNEYKYLGVWFNEQLKTTTMLKHVSLAGKRALACLIAKVKALGWLYYDNFYHLYNALVAPVMNYSSCIWGYEYQPTIESIQNNALRFYLNVGKYHPISALQGDMGWIPDTYRHYYEVLKWWLRIKSYTNRMTKNVLLWSIELASQGYKNWCWKVKKLCICIGIPDIYCPNEQTSFSIKEANEYISHHLLLVANDHWLEKLNKPAINSETGGKLQHYRVFKVDPVPACYVLAPLSPGHRWVLASLRAGCLPLAVETGRYRTPKVPLVDRLCLLCNCGQIEDEMHFLVECPYLHTERFNLFCNIARVDSEFITYSSYDKFLYLMSAERNVCIIAKGVYKMYQCRTSFLYNKTTN